METLIVFAAGHFVVWSSTIPLQLVIHYDYSLHTSHCHSSASVCCFCHCALTVYCSLLSCCYSGYLARILDLLHALIFLGWKMQRQGFSPFDTNKSSLFRIFILVWNHVTYGVPWTIGVGNRGSASDPENQT
jgi:hypothetical protein